MSRFTSRLNLLLYNSVARCDLRHARMQASRAAQRVVATQLPQPRLQRFTRFTLMQEQTGQPGSLEFARWAFGPPARWAVTSNVEVGQST